MNHRAYFITGTDTNIGKTYVATHLLKQFNQAGLKTIGLKPIASGAINGINEDALILQKSASIHLPLNIINPFVFEPPIAPHLAAEKVGIKLTANMIKDNICNTMHIYHHADHYIIEGAGGLLVPINDHETIADVIAVMNIPVILVVGIRLGCLNHTLLTAAHIESCKLPFAGWIANCLDKDCIEQTEIIEAIKKRIKAPWLCTIPYDEKSGT